MKPILMLFSALTLAACTSTPHQNTWSTPQMQQAKTDCAYEISLAKLSNTEHATKLDACLAQHGHKK